MDDVIGRITPPPYIQPGIDPSGKLTGIMVFLNSILRIVFVVAGVWAFINIIIAGYQFMTAGGNPKAIQHAWERIWQTFLGLVIIVASFLIAAVIGLLLFKDPTAILQPKLQ